MTAAAPLRVVEVGRGVAAPACGRLFAGLGHDVVKVEIGDGDPLRRQEPLNRSGTGLSFVALNADKRSQAVGELRALDTALQPLLVGADVLLLDLLPAEAAEAGLTRDRLRASWPDLVVVWITAFGPDSGFADLAGDSFLAESYGGLATMIGESSRRPLSLGGEQTAYCSGFTGFLGAMLALRRRDQGHGGDVVDVAMCDVAAYMDWKGDVATYLTGRAPRRSSGEGGEWKMVKARDGWVGVIFQQRHWPGVVELVDDPALRDPELANEVVRLARADEWWPVVDRWAKDRSAEEIYLQAQRLGLPFGWAVKASDLVRSEQLRGRGFVRPLAAEEIGEVPSLGAPAHSAALPWRAGRSPELGSAGTRPGWDDGRSNRRDVRPGPRPADQPLRGVVVLDFGTITAGAAATRLLADHGATVVKVEWVDRPDTFRSWKMPEDSSLLQEPAGPRPTSPYFPSNNVGKRDVAIDLKTEQGRDLVRRLAARSHVVVENFRVGVTERLGIDPTSLGRVNPDLVYLSLSSQGQDGPESRNISFGSTLDLLSGLAAVTGYEPDQPIWSSSDVNYPDQLVSMAGAAFVVYCLALGLTGVHLDLSQREAVSWTLDAAVADFLVNGRDSQITGNDRPGRTPHDTVPASEPDTWVAIACTTDAERAALARCAGFDDLLDVSAETWWRDRGHVRERIGDWSSRRTRDAAVAELRAAGVPAVPVLDAADRGRMPGFRTRLVTFPDTPVPVKGFPMRFTAYTVPVNPEAPAIGQDTAEVLEELAGVTAQELSRLEQQGVVHLGPAGPSRQDRGEAQI